MARGGRGRGSKRQNSSISKRNRSGVVTKRQKRHLREFGEVHPAEKEENDKVKYKRVEDGAALGRCKLPPKAESFGQAESSESSEEETGVANPLTELVSSFQNSDVVHEWDSSDGSSEDEESNDGETDTEDKTAARGSKVAEVSENMTGPKNYQDDIEEEVEDDEMDSSEDLFYRQFEILPLESEIKQLAQKENWQSEEFKWPTLRKLCFRKPKTFQLAINIIECKSRERIALLKPKLLAGWCQRQKGKGHADDGLAMNSLQGEVFSILNSYSDFMFCDRTFVNGEDLRDVYCLHALNHVLKTRSRVVHHNTKLKHGGNEIKEFRDQGLTRPKVLILVPFREAALRVVDAITAILLPEEGANVSNKKRFRDEFRDPDRGSHKEGETSWSRRKPPDHVATFAGNVDDNFRLGISVTKKALRLYADFYASDILLASPLGLRMAVGAEGESYRDYDFLSSIEVLIIDQAEVILMQNWEHVLHIMEHMHLQPNQSHGVDFSRVRLWTLEGWAKHFRQTLCFSAFSTPELNALFTRFCCNRAGLVRTVNPVVAGSIQSIAVHLPQVFRRFETESPADESDARFQFFVSKVLLQHTGSGGSPAGTVVFVSSYFDFVRLRNYFRKEDVDVVQISEYHSPGKVAQARDRFFHQKRKMLLYTERVHFYHRYSIKGVRHLIFYQLPVFPATYGELCNLTSANDSRYGGHDPTCSVLYSKYDALRLAAVVGTDRAMVMLNSEKDVHLLVTGDQ